MRFSAFSVLNLAFVFVVAAQSFRPSAAPIITRSPYLNAWATLYTSGGLQPNLWPYFWTSRIVGWAGFIRVDEDVYEWIGATMEVPGFEFNLPPGKTSGTATFKNLIITPTRTVYVMSAGPVQFNVTFLSPVEPEDLVLQSFPFGYVLVDVASSDGAAHRVQVFSDLSGEWLSSAGSVPIQWNTSISGPVLTHTVKLSSPNTLREFGDMSQDGVLYHATNPGDGVTWQSGGAVAVRGWFLTHGFLNNTNDTTFRNIDQDLPVFGFSHDLGSVTADTKSLVHAIGLARDPVIASSVTDGLQAFLADADNARARAIKLDERIQTESRKISSSYSDLVSLATRQTLAGIETVIGLSTDSISMFMKDVGSSTRVNPVETLYAAFPAFLYINSTWCQYLLEPLLQYQSSSRYNKSYAAPDLGFSYPVAEGEPDTDDLRSIDDTSAMLIMTWAHARFSGQQGLLNTYYSTLQKWAEHLISSNALNPFGAKTADGLNADNMTNLAIKAIIGVRSMAEISHTLGKGDEASKYQNQASSWASSWRTQAFSSGHLTSTYGASDSWALIYNLYPDKLLRLGLVGDDIYDAQDNFYTGQGSSRDTFGFPFDSNAVGKVKSQWTLLTAATTKDVGVRNSLIKMVLDKVVDVSNITAFPTSYNSQDGKLESGSARQAPAQGAVYGLLTLNLENKLPGLSRSSDVGPGRKRNTGAIVGGVVGGLAVLALVIVGILFYYRRKQKSQLREHGERKRPLATFFRRGGTDSYRPPSGSLGNTSGSFTAPLPTGSSSGFQSQISYQSPTNSHGDASGPAISSGQQTLSITPFPLSNRGRTTNQEPPPAPKKSQFARNYSPQILRHSTITTSLSVDGSSNVSRLHREMENLRRDVEDMRSRTMYEPPPEYT
ncbi:hypothetical protein PQX77_017461 [Marasmius sp. AFHP31]|nr:hypothetical protein PQX77_017461 [Marasmius sp. AFHP31]